MEIKGENIRQTEWYQRFTDELIAQYVSLKDDLLSDKSCGKVSLKGEIYFLLRKGKVLDPIWRFTPGWQGQEIKLPIDDE